MKKKINKKDIPGYAYGANEVVGAVTNGLAATMPYATSGKATVGTALGGMASGAAAGAALGPWGAVAGAAVGGIMGSIGSGGSVDEYTGEITNPSGIAGLFGHSKGYLQRKSNRIKNSNIGRQLTDALRSDYYNNSMAEYNPNTFAEGGIVPTTLGWVDDGEFGRNTDGTLFKVPDEGKPTDSNLMLLEVGSQLWSPNLKNPNTGNYFSIDAENIAKKYKTNGTDKYAKTTKSLNDAQMHKELDDLLAVQESVKMKKNKTKGDLPAYEGGKNGKEELAAEIAARKKLQLDPTKMLVIELPDGTRVLLDLYGNRYNFEDFGVLDWSDRPTVYTGVAPSAGKWNGSMNFAKQMLNSKNVAKLKNTATRVFGNNAKSVKPATVKPVSPNAKPVGDNAKKLEEALEETRRVQDLNRAMMSQAWLRGRTVPNNLAGTTAGRDVASQGLWNLPNASSAVDDVLVGEGFRSNWPYYLGLAGMVGGAGTFLTHEATKDNPPYVSEASKTYNPSLISVAPVSSTLDTDTSSNTSTTSEKNTPVVIDNSKKVNVKKPTSKNNTTSTVSSPENITTPLKQVSFSPQKTRFTSLIAQPSMPNTARALTTDDYINAANIADKYKKATTSSRNLGLADALGYVGQLAAPIANIIEGSKDTETVDPVYVTPTFGRVSIDPRNALRHIRNTQGLTNYNANNLGGAGMAYSLLNASNTNAAISDLYSNVYDKEVGLSFTNANIANDVARYNADAKRAANEAYAQNKASKHNMKMTGISQLGHLSGQIPRDIKLNRNNTALTKATEKWLAQYMPKADVNELFNMLNYGR